MMSLDICKEKTQQWLLDLQVERKCNSTNAVNKAIEQLDEAGQLAIINLLSAEIKQLLDHGNNIDLVQKAANVLNGCFDNFPYALKAVSVIFNNIIFFLGECLQQCLSFIRNEPSSLNFDKLGAVDLLHVLSRISTLVLKLRRRNDSTECSSELPFAEFPALSVTISDIICFGDGVAIDTRINLAMSLWLIKEVATESEQQLVELHQSFCSTLSEELQSEAYYTILAKFVMAAAAINIWDESIVTPPQTTKYLGFFLGLCERYSSETPILLMSCRALQVLGKHKSFLLHQLTDEERNRLVSCNFMLLEHPVPCARHSGRDLLSVVVKIPTLQPVIIKTMLNLTLEQKAFFICLASLANVMDTRLILVEDLAIPERAMAAIGDPTSVSHVSFAIESMALHDSLVGHDLEQWCDLWIMPLLSKLSSCLPIVSADIEKLLLKVLKESPGGIEIVLRKWKNPETDEQLRGIITCLKIQNKLKGGDGSKLCHLLSKSQENSVIVLKTCLKHGEDDIRLAAFSLVAEGLLLSQSELELVLYFLKYNLNNPKPATRQKTLSLIKKMLVRVNSVYMNLVKPAKNREVTVTAGAYVNFVNNLIEFLYNNIFAAANFNRLNTVLNTLLLCQDILDPSFIEKTVLHDKKWWPKCLVALESSYEENKIITVALARKLPFDDFDSGTLCQQLRQAFGRIQELEPPNVLYGAYYLSVLLRNPLAPSVLRKFFSSTIDSPSTRADVLCLQILASYLRVQIQEAEDNLLNAARLSPMYGTMFVIRLLLKELDKNALILAETKKILKDLIGYSFAMGDAVSSVVNNSSPEGHLPMDFQQLVDVNKGENEDFPLLYEVVPKTGSLGELMGFYKEAKTAEEKLSLAGSIRERLEDELEKKLEHDRRCYMFDVDCAAWFDSIWRIRELIAEYDSYYKFFEGHLPRIKEERPLTAQALLLCSWRSMKESCLYLGDLASKLPLKEALETGLLTEDLIDQIGAKLRLLLSSIKHRGAFEQADVGFSSLCLALWKCPISRLQELPYQWLQEVLQEILLDPNEQKVKFTSTRRSAGLPFLIQAIISTEVASNFSPSARCLHMTMNALFDIVERDCVDNLETRLHAINIMRSLFKHAQLGEFVAPYVSRALIVAIRGSRATTWPERNSSNMLFSALVIRVFGVARSRNQLSKKNKMTTRIFFQRFPELKDFLLSEMSRMGECIAGGVNPQPSLYLVLLILGRLYPLSFEEFEELGLDPFIQYMTMCAANPIYRIRLLAARAIVPLIPTHNVSKQIERRITTISKQNGVTENLRHGLLLQVRELLEEANNSVIDPPDLSSCWWILAVAEHSGATPRCFPILHAFTDVLWCLWRNFPAVRPNLRNVLREICDLPLLTYWASKNGAGVQPFLASLLLLRLEALADDCLTTKSPSSTAEFMRNVVFLTSCGYEVVENVVLHFVYCVLTKESLRDADLDFSLTEGLVESMPSLADNKRVELKQLLSAEWGHYVEEEISLLKNVRIHQQRRLRLVILGSILKSSPHDKSPSNKSLETLCLYASFWNPAESPRSFRRPEGGFVHSDFVYERLATVAGCLIDEDRQCRLALAEIFDTAWWSLLSQHQEPSSMTFLKFWLYPFRLLLDEDETVRCASQGIVENLTKYFSGTNDTAASIPEGGLTSQRLQEMLVQCFTHMRPPGTSFVDLTCLAVLTVTQFDDIEENDPLEIFKRGNPNPYCEKVALTLLFIQEALRCGNAAHLSSKFSKQQIDGLSLELSPFFARHGLRLKPVNCVSELLSELSRLDPSEPSVSDVFRHQISVLLSLKKLS